MTPSPEFYENIRRGELNNEVKAWKRAEFVNYRAFSCQVISSNGKTLQGILETYLVVLGAGAIKIPFEAENLVGNSFLLGMVEKNKNQLGLQGIDGLDYKQIARSLDLTIERQYGDIYCGHVTAGYTLGYGLDFIRNLAADYLDKDKNPYRRNWRGQSDASSALGLATHFKDVFPGWNIEPLRLP